MIFTRESVADPRFTLDIFLAVRLLYFLWESGNQNAQILWLSVACRSPNRSKQYLVRQDAVRETSSAAASGLWRIHVRQAGRARAHQGARLSPRGEMARPSGE